MPKSPKLKHANRCKSAHLSTRDRLLLEHLPLVRYIASSIHARLPQHVPIDDLVQAGVIGLIQAIDNFDCNRKVPLKAYAQLRIRGAILDNLRDLDWSPRSLRAMARRIESVQALLRERLGRPPEDEEVSGQLGMSLKDYQKLLSSIQGLDITRLSVGPFEDDIDNSLDQEIPDPKGEDPFSLYLDTERRAALADAMTHLSYRERQVLSLYYFNELTMKEIGRTMGVGESRASQLHSAGLKSLRFCLKPTVGAARYVKMSASHVTEGSAHT
ncbi:MAG TPA: FliA/WhiG family RNA polymerase sigma factor [Terriglobales bacterium]|nr:FliA/WhiG family RNA polymerase sigma factor [Terriglobales bacterium]